MHASMKAVVVGAREPTSGGQSAEGTARPEVAGVSLCDFARNTYAYVLRNI